MLRHYISCAEISKEFSMDRENVHFIVSFKAFRELLIRNKDAIIAVNGYNSRIFIKDEDIYFYNGITPTEVEQLLDMVKKDMAVAV